MEKARLRLINEQPFYALFLNKCRVVWNERVGTAGVRLNRRAEVELHVCRAYFDSMDVKRQVGILIHEMLLDDGKDGPLTAALFSLLMTLGTRGKQFTLDDLRRMLTSAGFGEPHVQVTYGYY